MVVVGSAGMEVEEFLCAVEDVVFACATKLVEQGLQAVNDVVAARVGNLVVAVHVSLVREGTLGDVMARLNTIIAGVDDGGGIERVASFSDVERFRFGVGLGHMASKYAWHTVYKRLRGFAD